MTRYSGEDLARALMDLEARAAEHTDDPSAALPGQLGAAGVDPVEAVQFAAEWADRVEDPDRRDVLGHALLVGIAIGVTAAPTAD